MELQYQACTIKKPYISYGILVQVFKGSIILSSLLLEINSRIMCVCNGWYNPILFYSTVCMDWFEEIRRNHGARPRFWYWWAGNWHSHSYMYKFQTHNSISFARPINSTYKMMRRIEAEELSLDAAELVITSTKQEIEEQWELYDGFDVNLEKVLCARGRRGANCHGRYMPRMAVLCCHLKIWRRVNVQIEVMISLATQIHCIKFSAN